MNTKNWLGGKSLGQGRQKFSEGLLASDWGGKVDKKRKHIDPRYGFDLLLFFI